MKAILHADRNWGIGKDNGLMFSIPTDMKFFRSTTAGGVLIMGANTLRSFPGGKPLKNRVNIVFSKTMQREDCIIIHSFAQLKEELEKQENKNVWVIGGETIYRMLLPYCEEVFVTRVEADGNADTFFPNLDKESGFEKTKTGEMIEDNGYQIHFDEYKNLCVQSL